MTKSMLQLVLDEVTTQFISIFESMDNEYMKERAADIRDVSKRVLAHILGVDLPNPSLIKKVLSL